MRPANHFHIAAELRACGTDVMLATHARERVLERTAMAPSRVQELIATHKAVLLPWQSGNRSYHLLFDVDKQDFSVGVVAIERGKRDSRSATAVTVLTRQQFENDIGKKIEKHTLRLAASRSLDPVAFRKWDMEAFGENVSRPRYRVTTIFTKPDGTTGREVFSRPPVCRAFVEEHSLEHAGSHPGFWEWYARLAAVRNINLDSVIAMRIADLDKVTLRVDAPPRACPCCTGKTTPDSLH